MFTRWFFNIKRSCGDCRNNNCSNAKSINAVGNTTRKNDNKHFGEWTLSSDYFSLRSFSLWFVHSLKRRQEMLKIMLMKYNVMNKF